MVGLSPLDCPHCGLPALSVWKKLTLGWARRVPCGACGLHVTVAPVPALLAALPCVLAVVATLARWVRDPVSLALMGVGAIAATAWLHAAWVPLAKAQVTDLGAVQQARARAGVPRT
ncbi:MAG: hypothetical protein Q4G71_12500 [Pseudomonadota bacterium]|nr:hypothetical protein [Pseudomonadota bacterium]